MTAVRQYVSCTSQLHFASPEGGGTSRAIITGYLCSPKRSLNFPILKDKCIVLQRNGCRSINDAEVADNEGSRVPTVLNLASGLFNMATFPSANRLYVDASRSTFYDIRGNQNFYIQVKSSDPDSIEIFDQLPHAVAGAIQSHISDPGDVNQRHIRALECLNHASSGPEDILLLITDIRLLIGRDNSSCSYSYVALDLELHSLHQILLVTAAGLKAYQYTQLGRSLTELINPYLTRCLEVLRALFLAIDSYKKCLLPTAIWSLWRLVWWNACEGRELVLWRDKLFSCRRSLCMFIRALDLIPWTPLGNQLCTGTPFLNDFLTAIKYCPPSPHDLEVSKVLVMDHLGESISVPIVFCSSQRNFHYIINGYCRDRPGNNLVARKDYLVIHADNKRIFTPTEFEFLQSGKSLEMSILLRVRKTDKRGMCPRCRYINSTTTGVDGWIDCWGCPARFQVVRAFEGGNLDDEWVNGDENVESGDDGESGKEGDQESHKGSKRIEDQRNGMRDVTGDDITSSDFRDAHIPPGDKTITQNEHDIQCFRRISVLFKANHEEALSIGTGNSCHGLRLLSLDGGGIRGLSVLLILRELMQRIQHDGEAMPRPCDYFDLIGGVGTGGLIAIMLGRLQLTINDAIDAYVQISREVLSVDNWNTQDSTFKASKLEETVKEIVKSYGLEGSADERMMDPRPVDEVCKSFVCCTPALHVRPSSPSIFRTYWVSKDRSFNCSIWQAARATCAAPTFFEPISIGEEGSEKEFVHVGLGCNNPGMQVLNEAEAAFGSDQHVACLISIGSGVGPKSPDASRRALPIALQQIATHCELVADGMRKRFNNVPNGYFRFNAEQGLQGLSLAEGDKLGETAHYTKQYIHKSSVSQMIDTAVDAVRERRAIVKCAEITGSM